MREWKHRQDPEPDYNVCWVDSEPWPCAAEELRQQARRALETLRTGAERFQEMLDRGLDVAVNWETGETAPFFSAAPERDSADFAIGILSAALGEAS